MTSAARPDWHAQSRAAVLDRLQATGAGLSSDEARERLARYGPNELPEAAGPSATMLLLRQVHSPLMYALMVSAFVAIVLGELEDGFVVLAVVVLNALIGFVQEYRAGRAIAALAELVAEPARVRRDGQWLEVRAEEVVPGDVVSVTQGDRIPADLRVLHAEGLRAQRGNADRRARPRGQARCRGGGVDPDRRAPGECSTRGRRSPPDRARASPWPPAAAPSWGGSRSC